MVLKDVIDVNSMSFDAYSKQCGYVYMNQNIHVTIVRSLTSHSSIHYQENNNEYFLCFYFQSNIWNLTHLSTLS